MIQVFHLEYPSITIYAGRLKSEFLVWVSRKTCGIKYGDG